MFVQQILSPAPLLLKQVEVQAYSGVNRYTIDNDTPYTCYVAPGRILTGADVKAHRQVKRVSPAQSSGWEYDWANYNNGGLGLLIDSSSQAVTVYFESSGLLAALFPTTPIFRFTAYKPGETAFDTAGGDTVGGANAASFDQLLVATTVSTAAGVLAGQYGDYDLFGYNGVLLSVYSPNFVGDTYCKVQIFLSDSATIDETFSARYEFFAKSHYIEIPRVGRYLRVKVFAGAGQAAAAQYGVSMRRTQDSISLKHVGALVSPLATEITSVTGNANFLGQVNPSALDSLIFGNTGVTAPGALATQQGDFDLSGWNGVDLSVWGLNFASDIYSKVAVYFSDTNPINEAASVQFEFFAKSHFIQLPRIAKYCRIKVFNGAGSGASAQFVLSARRTQENIQYQYIGFIVPPLASEQSGTGGNANTLGQITPSAVDVLANTKTSSGALGALLATYGPFDLYGWTGILASIWTDLNTDATAYCRVRVSFKANSADTQAQSQTTEFVGTVHNISIPRNARYVTIDVYQGAGAATTSGQHFVYLRRTMEDIKYGHIGTLVTGLPGDKPATLGSPNALAPVAAGALDSLLSGAIASGAVGALIYTSSIFDLSGWAGLFLTIYCDQASTKSYGRVDVEFSDSPTFAGTATLSRRYYGREFFFTLPKVRRYFRFKLWNGSGSVASVQWYADARRTQSEVKFQASAMDVRAVESNGVINVPTHPVAGYVSWIPVMPPVTRITLFYGGTDSAGGAMIVQLKASDSISYICPISDNYHPWINPYSLGSIINPAVYDDKNSAMAGMFPSNGVGWAINDKPYDIRINNPCEMAVVAFYPNLTAGNGKVSYNFLQLHNPTP